MFGRSGLGSGVCLAFVMTLSAIATSLPAAAAPSQAQLWDALRTGQAFAMIRHALAPGTGDPSSFAIDDCSTQRNLNDVGRTQARRIGDLFRANGISEAQVMTSQWCRCRDTATEMAVGEVQDLVPLNSFFEARERSAAQTKALQDWLTARAGTKTATPLVLVTHFVNIGALLRAFPSSGEIVVGQRLGPRRFQVLGTIETLP
ncbi:MAG: histidine phosphatase family protein, partial [Pseudomonadota bacterium]